jgi:hypothetical protein
MSTALQAFQYKRKLNKAIKHVQAPFMGKNKSSAKQESSSWINSITGKKHDDAKREVDVNHQDSKQKSFLPWHKQNVEEEGPQASPDNDQPESSELVAVKDGGMKPGKGDDEGLMKEKKSPKREALFKRRNRHVSDNGEETNKEPPSPSNNDETKSTAIKKEKKKDNDDDWWMDDNDSESENDVNESSHHKKVVPDEDEPEYNPRAEAEYAKASGGGSSWWE